MPDEPAFGTEEWKTKVYLVLFLFISDTLLESWSVEDAVEPVEEIALKTISRALVEQQKRVQEKKEELAEMPYRAQVGWLRATARNLVRDLERRAGNSRKQWLKGWLETAGRPAPQDLAAIIEDGRERLCRRLLRKFYLENPKEYELLEERFGETHKLKELIEYVRCEGENVSQNALNLRVWRRLKVATGRLQSRIQRVDQVLESLELCDLRDLLRVLPEEQREILELYYSDLMHFDDIGKLKYEGLTPAARATRVKRQFRLGLVQLLRHFDREYLSDSGSAA
jgi:hypothetical protein